LLRECGAPSTECASTEEVGVRRDGGGTAAGQMTPARGQRCMWGEGVKMTPARGHLRAGTAAHLPKRRNGLRFGFCSTHRTGTGAGATGQRAHYARAGCAFVWPHASSVKTAQRLNYSRVRCLFFSHLSPLLIQPFKYELSRVLKI